MGSNSSRYNVYAEVPEVAPYQSTFEALQLTRRDVGRMYKLFRKITGPDEVYVDRKSLLDFLDVDRNPFTLRVFSVFDEDGSGTVDFREFVISSWNYCTLGNTTLALFAFDLYDRDNSGHIDAEEVELMLRDIYGRRYKTNLHATRILEKLAIMKHVEFDKDVFRDFVLKHPNMLYPVFHMQKQIKKCILGIRFWEEYSSRRMEMCDGKYLSIAQIIKLLHEKAVQAKLKKSSGGRVAESLNFDEILAADGEARRRNQGKKKIDRDVHVRGSVTSTDAAIRHVKEKKREKETGVVAKHAPSQRDLSWFGALKRLIGIDPPPLLQTQPSPQKSHAGSNSTNTSTIKRTLRSDSTVSLVGESNDGERGESARVVELQAKPKGDIDTLFNSYGLSTRRLNGGLVQSDFDHLNAPAAAAVTGGHQKSYRYTKQRSGSSVSPTPSSSTDTASETLESKSPLRRGTRLSFGEDNASSGRRRMGGELITHQKLQYEVDDAKMTLNGHGGGALACEEAVEASRLAKAARREQAERANMRALAESSAGGGSRRTRGGGWKKRKR